MKLRGRASQGRRPRWEDSYTLREFSGLLPYVIQGKTARILNPEEASVAWGRRVQVQGGRKVRALWDANSQRVISFPFCDGNPDGVPYAAAEIEPFVEPAAPDIQFLDRLVRVFNDDVRHAPTMLIDDELWTSLRQTQFRRAITKYSAFKKRGMLQWLQALEMSTRLRYEGQPFALTLVMTYHLEYIVDNLSTEYVPFHTPINFSDAVLGEKWIRAVTQSQRVGLVGLSTGKIVGFFVIPPAANGMEQRWRFAPHSDLRGVQQLVRGGTCAFITSAAGDVRVILPDGATFLNSQSRWQYTRYEGIVPALKQYMNEEMAVSLLRAALDLSFERHGALLCVVPSAEHLSFMIPDFTDPRTNRQLRQSVRRLNLLSMYQRDVIVSVASIDGAVVFDQDGSLLDAACMVADPAIERVKELGFRQPYRGFGARETAAWNASLYGIAVKISADGPVTFYRHGKVIASLG
jgi:hypothetical protein